MSREVSSRAVHRSGTRTTSVMRTGNRRIGSAEAAHIDCQRDVADGSVSRMRIQSPSPSVLLPGGVKLRLPRLAKGEPGICLYVPRLGSYQLAVAWAASIFISTEIVRREGK